MSRKKIDHGDWDLAKIEYWDPFQGTNQNARLAKIMFSFDDHVPQFTVGDMIELSKSLFEIGGLTQHLGENPIIMYELRLIETSDLQAIFSVGKTFAELGMPVRIEGNSKYVEIETSPGFGTSIRPYAGPEDITIVLSERQLVGWSIFYTEELNQKIAAYEIDKMAEISREASWYLTTEFANAFELTRKPLEDFGKSISALGESLNTAWIKRFEQKLMEEMRVVSNEDLERKRTKWTK